MQFEWGGNNSLISKAADENDKAQTLMANLAGNFYAYLKQL